MQKFTALLIAAMISVTGAIAAFATEYTKGTVKKVDMKAGKVTIIHEELTNLDMPAMTMVFRTADPTMLEKMKEGDAIEFVADRVKGKLTVTELK
ncbi:copper-binding protein [Hoeflea alexandrii]|uniref:copper-binding protein n=1 Tax=Hoeflea alexandrii TaxID=288436 RepID=UPI0022AECB22|nr:copper-binding protein [Hoeflea alexandrii]MCZ4292355.1 copper-binding protein [Hoeflea alexandrii]